MDQSALTRLIGFVQGLQDARISFSLDCVRDAIMITIPFGIGIASPSPRDYMAIIYQL